MKRLLQLTSALLALFLLAGCASGPRTNIFPPQVRIQELAVQADGSWNLRMRIENFSNVPMRFTGLKVRITLDDKDAGELRLEPDRDIGPNSAEVFDTRFTPSTEARIAADARYLPYSLQGEVSSVDPRRSYKLKYDSGLNPTPGIPNTFR